MKKTAIRIISFALLLTVASTLFLTSCGKEETPAESGSVMTPEEISKAQKIIDDADRAEYMIVFEKYIRYLEGDAELIDELFPSWYWGDDAEGAKAAFLAKYEKTVAENKKKYGDDYKVTYTIEVERNYSPFLNDANLSYGYKYDMKGESATKGYDLYVVLNYKGSVSEGTDEFYLHPLFIGDNWYIASNGTDFN